MPKGAKVVGQPTASAPGAAVQVRSLRPGVDQDGRTFAQATALLPPRGRATLTWSYVVPKAAGPAGHGLPLTDVVATQSMLTSPTLPVTVLPPEGWAVASPAGWAAK